MLGPVFNNGETKGITDQIISEIEKEIQEESNCAMQIVREQPDLIKCFEGGKLYLKTEKILVDQEGIFVCDDSSVISLPVIHKSKQGSYLTFQPKDEWRDLYKCSNPKCEYEFLGAWNWWKGASSVCPTCGSTGYKM